jgi:hypothetical protein
MHTDSLASGLASALMTGATAQGQQSQIDVSSVSHNDLKAAYRAIFRTAGAPRNATKAQLAEAIQSREPAGAPVPGSALLEALSGPPAVQPPPSSMEEPPAAPAPVVREQKTVVVAPDNRKALAAALLAQSTGGR